MEKKIYDLPKSVLDVIDHYFNLKLGSKNISTPYFMNLKKSKDLRAMVGKGTPEEIEMESKIWAKLKKVNLDSLSEEAVRSFLMQRDIGIDCSGFVIHTLDSWYSSEKKNHIWNKLKPYRKNILYRIAYLLKPVEKLGAEIITNQENSTIIEIKDVLPGDTIRTKWKKKNSHHILLVSKVHKSGGKVTEIEYVNSAENYGNASGMRKGKIIIKDEMKPLQEQEWIDPDENGTNHVYEGYLFNVEDNGIRRIKAMEELQKKNYEEQNNTTVKG